MASSPLARRIAAVALLVGALLLAGAMVTSTLTAYVEGQWEIAAKQTQLRSLRELAAARSAFERLAPRKGGGSTAASAAPMPAVLPADADPAAVLQAAVTHAAEGQQVIVDGIDALPPETVTRPAAVHLRATQAGLYNFLRSIEEQTPYVLVPRLEVTPSRSADPEHGKPFVVSADLRLAVLVTPPLPTRRPAPPADLPAP